MTNHKTQWERRRKYLIETRRFDQLHVEENIEHARATRRETENRMALSAARFLRDPLMVPSKGFR